MVLNAFAMVTGFISLQYGIVSWELTRRSQQSVLEDHWGLEGYVPPLPKQSRSPKFAESEEAVDCTPTPTARMEANRDPDRLKYYSTLAEAPNCPDGQAVLVAVFPPSKFHNRLRWKCSNCLLLMKGMWLCNIRRTAECCRHSVNSLYRSLQRNCRKHPWRECAQ